MKSTSPLGDAAGSAPRAEYAERQAIARREAGTLRARERSIGNLRLAVFLGGIALAWLAFDLGALPRGVVALPMALFATLVIAHDRVIRSRDCAERKAAHYEHGLARIDGTWIDRGHRGDRYADLQHPYSGDLDIFGRGSLFQLLCTARSACGQASLAGWLIRGAAPDEVAARQQAVGELRADIDRRERLALAGASGASDIDPAYLSEWAARPLPDHLRYQRAAAVLLVSATATAFVMQGLDMVPPAVFLAAAAAQTAFGLRRRQANQSVARSLELAPIELTTLVCLLHEIEGSDFTAPRLQQLRDSVAGSRGTASAEIARLNRLVQLLDARRNILFAPLAPLLLWTTQVSFAIEAWRRAHGPDLDAWMRAAGEYESFCALAGFAYEQPTTSFPQVGNGPAGFTAAALRHPMLPADRCVANDVALDGECSLLVVSGSNMSGKSTLLRTIGTNAVLAQAGAPVCASHLRMSSLQIGTSMRVQDSLLDGTSHFYAEIKRLKLVVDLAGGDPPLLFLLDEVLHGTNSHDRGIGAEAIVGTLLSRGAIGLITTHDLTLAAVADNLAPRARNVHFADRLIDGEMIFDYKMHDGPVRKSNALGLMRAIGLEV